MTAPANARVRIRFEYDTYAHFENEYGGRGPLTPEQYAAVGPFSRNGQPQTYGEYRRYHGNPDRYVYAIAICETRCTACGTWSDVGSVGWIECMDDDRETSAIDGDPVYSPDDAPGYLGDIARELFAEYGPRETTEPTTYRTDADVVTALLEAFEDPTIPDAAFGARVRAILERRAA